MWFLYRPSWESYRWCGQETQGPFLTSTAPHCGPAPIVTTPSSLGRTLNLELQMVARCTLSTLGHSDGPVICEGGPGGRGCGVGVWGGGGRRGRGWTATLAWREAGRPGGGRAGEAGRAAAWPGGGAGRPARAHTGPEPPGAGAAPDPIRPGFDRPARPSGPERAARPLAAARSDTRDASTSVFNMTSATQ